MPKKRLNVILSDADHAELDRMAAENESTMTDVIRTAIRLMKITQAETSQGHRVVICDKENKLLKEIVLP